MSEITGGELCARALEADGIEFPFGLPAPEIDALLIRAIGPSQVPQPAQA